MDTGFIAGALLLILCCLAVLGMVWTVTTEPQQPEPLAVEPTNKPHTELAHLVWAAHTANQRLDSALLNGGPTEIRDAEATATIANSRLVAYLSEKADR